MKVINWDSNTVIRIQLWDIAGEFIFITSQTELYIFNFIYVCACCVQCNCPAYVLAYNVFSVMFCLENKQLELQAVSVIYSQMFLECS